MKYNPELRTSMQAAAETVLLTMSHNCKPESFAIADEAKLRDEEKPWIPWTPENLVRVLHHSDSSISLPNVTEALDVLASSGLIIRRDSEASHRELTTLGRKEAERLGEPS
jgi:hypothetical protein